MGTYGLGVATTIVTNSNVNEACVNDYINIPGSVPSAAPTTLTQTAVHNFCGRYFGSAAALTAHATMCSNSVPFNVGVNFDDIEITTTITINMPNNNEINGFPGGIVGFRLVYTQGSC